MFNLAKKMFGSENDRQIKRMQPLVKKINDLEPQFEALSDSELRAKTDEYRKRYEDGETLDKLLPEAFATVREAAKRTLGQRHYDVQLIGGICLHRGEIAEMRTGEGKTLVATLPVYLNSIPQKGVHVVTVNDYLASRDAEWMGQVYAFLGLTTGIIVNGINDVERKAAYNCDVTYGTNNEYGFDYLRDNMKYSVEDMVQRGHHYSIIDEVDSILIDEARTPLIISGPTDDRSDFYRTIDTIIPELTDEHFELDEKARSVTLNEEGNEAVEQILQARDLLQGDSLYDIENVSVVHHVNQALRAHKLYKKDKDYIIKGDKVVLIDEFTGRMMEGRRLSEGLHQAIEAKEQVDIQSENVTLASVTFQNYFRLYEKLAGMTGTALTEASEFADIYKLSVLDIPTNRPIQRIDDHDEIYRSAREKYDAIIAEIMDAQSRQQPILVGTVSIEKSEILADLLEKSGIPHKVLNARYHEQEAAIVAQAGVPGAVTIATNMAGRGTDIQLGGNLEMRLEEEAPEGETPEQRAKREEKLIEEIAVLKKQALDAGGLYVLGTERHESRRIDNQLRGRTGRQGDPGRSKFYISTEDDLMRIFGGDRLESMMEKLGWDEGEALTHRWMNKAIERAQKRVEQRNFDIRKNLLKYDDVMNDQRKAIFEQRLDFMTSESVGDVVDDMRHEVIEDMVNIHIPPKAYAEQWDIDGLNEKVRNNLRLDLPLKDWAAEEGIADAEMIDRIIKQADALYAAKKADIGDDVIQNIEKRVLLQIIDSNWREHLQQLDHLRSVIGFRSYGQRDPLNEYKGEAFALFDNLLTNLREGVTRIMMSLQLQPQDAPPAPQPPRQMRESRIDPATGENTAAPAAARTDVPGAEQTWGKIARNAPCPCGSGKKYKHCHGSV